MRLVVPEIVRPILEEARGKAFTDRDWRRVRDFIPAYEWSSLPPARRDRPDEVADLIEAIDSLLGRSSAQKAGSQVTPPEGLNTDEEVLIRDPLADTAALAVLVSYEVYERFEFVREWRSRLEGEADQEQVCAFLKNADRGSRKGDQNWPEGAICLTVNGKLRPFLFYDWSSTLGRLKADSLEVRKLVPWNESDTVEFLLREMLPSLPGIQCEVHTNEDIPALTSVQLTVPLNMITADVAGFYGKLRKAIAPRAKSVTARRRALAVHCLHPNRKDMTPKELADSFVKRFGNLQELQGYDDAKNLRRDVNDARRGILMIDAVKRGTK